MMMMFQKSILQRYTISLILLSTYCNSYINLVMAVDRSKFRTCAQTSFCRRHRGGRSKPQYQYQLLPNSIQFHHDSKNINPNEQEGEIDEKRGDTPSSSSTQKNKLNPSNDNNNSESNSNTKNGGFLSTIKRMVQLQTTVDDSAESTIDPYLRGPNSYLTARIQNISPIPSSGMLEYLNLAIHLHSDGVARIRITEDYQCMTDTTTTTTTTTTKDEKEEKDSSSCPYSKARWTSDELILNHSEMKAAHNVQMIDSSTDDGARLILHLIQNIFDNDNKEKEDIPTDWKQNYMVLQFGGNSIHPQDDEEEKLQPQQQPLSSLLMIQFNPFALYMWRHDDGDQKDPLSYGKPLIMMNTENLMHFEIRRLKKNQLEKQTQQQQQQPKEHENENSDIIQSNHNKQEKEIVGYWEDGLAIYADGTREERTKPVEIIDETIDIQPNRKLIDNEQDTFIPDTNGMWGENFGSHHDSKPYGPMSVGADITFPTSKFLYGLPEHASSTLLKNTAGSTNRKYQEPYRLYNLDVFEYELDETMALYGEVPLIVSQSLSGGTVGVFWFNPSETFVDLEDTVDQKGLQTHWMSESGVLDIFLLPGPNPKQLYSQYARLTGRMPIPPMFSLGYHQCRWNYRDEQDVYQVHAKFEELDYPYDVLWLDIEHTDGKRYFTWDAKLFPTPEAMQQKLMSQGRRMVTIIDPHIKRDNNYYIHSEATKGGYYIKDKDCKKDYDGWCWPGSSSYLDFTNKKVSSWWSDQFSYDKYRGSTSSLFTWNDMNEPSVFNGPEVSMQKDLRNLDNIEHREWHNLYGVLFHKATSDGLIRRNKRENERPFVLSRSFFAGSQRYGAIWTGDNESSWGHLKIATPMLLSLNVAALSFVGADVGGFFGNPDAELMTRWMQAGAYQPFFRGHAHHDSKRREPWMFGEEWMIRMRKAAINRYELLPYWYTTFREASITGMPVMRAMWMQYPTIEELFPLDDQYMIGSDLLVKPVTDAGVTHSQVTFPCTDYWYNVDTMKRVELSSPKVQTVTVDSNIDTIPVFQRGGSVIPRKLRLRRSTELMKNDPYTIYIALDNVDEAYGELYMDDEHSFNYDRKQQFGVAKFSVRYGNVIQNASTIGSSWNDYDRMIERIIVMGASQAPTKLVTDDGRSLSFDYDPLNKILVIRKPELSAMSNWSITFQ